MSKRTISEIDFKMKVIYVDIDETICHRETSVDFGTTHDYTKAKPIPENIQKNYV